MGIKLLLADDSITIQKVVGIIFANEDYELTVASNGNAALEKIRETKPDILLIDAIMPGKTGFEVSEEIKRDPELRNIPILLLTGAFEPFDEEKAKNCGADDFISKPFESQHLIDKVTALVELARKTAPPADDFATFEVPPPEEYSVPVEEPLQPAAELPVFPEPVEESPVVLSQQAQDSGTEQFKVDVVEAKVEDDLWKAFELEGMSVSEPPEFGVTAIEDDSSVSGFEEEPELAHESHEISGGVTATSEQEQETEETLIFEEEPVGAAEYEVVSEDQFEVLQENATEIEASTPDSSELFTMVEPEPVLPGSVFQESPIPPPEEEKIFAGEETAQSIGEDQEIAIPSHEEEQETPFLSLKEFEPTPEASEPAVTIGGDDFESRYAPDIEGVDEEVKDLKGEDVQEEIPSRIEPKGKVCEITLAPEDEFELEDKTLPVRQEVESTGQVEAAVSYVLTDEQLAGIVSKISREILERIAWEVVPDLAERIIREEIQKIKEG